MTKTAADPRTAAYERFRENLFAGVTFYYHAESARSADRLNYDPPISAREYSEALRVLADFAGHDNWSAAVTAAILPAVGQHTGGCLNVARINDAAHNFLAKPWHDFISATGPEAGRPSSHHHEATPRQRALVSLLVAELEAVLDNGTAPGIGWALSDFCDEVGIDDYDRSRFPRSVKRS